MHFTEYEAIDDMRAVGEVGDLEIEEDDAVTYVRVDKLVLLLEKMGLMEDEIVEVVTSPHGPVALRKENDEAMAVAPYVDENDGWGVPRDKHKEHK